MANILDINGFSIARFAELPAQGCEVTLRGKRVHVAPVITNYARRIEQHYAALGVPSMQQVCERAGIDMPFAVFGVALRFAEPFELQLFAEEQTLDEGFKQLIARFGLVIVRNAYLDERGRAEEHRARFQQLNFHRDRGAGQTTQYSVYTRNPFDNEQVAPRTCSTLFVANVVARLQAQKEGLLEPGEAGMRSHYNLFSKENIDDLDGKVIARHPWDCPHGVGEISMIDNRTVFHASYYPSFDKGYRIGVRYVA